MSQNVNLSISGINTSSSDFNGLPPGCLDVADNVEIRYKNVAEPRRGFEELASSDVAGLHFIKLTNFYISGTDRTIGLTSDNTLVYYTGANPWPAVPGSVSSNILPPNAMNGKCKFLHAGSNLYLTAKDGIRSLSSGSTASMIYAGVPVGLNLDAETNGASSGFFSTHVALTTTATLNSGNNVLTRINDTTGLVVGQYVSTDPVAASLVVQDLTYTAVTAGTGGNAITIAYTTGGTAGSEVVSVVSNAISVQIQSGTSTATQIRTALLASAPAIALVGVVVSGTGSNTQTAPTGPTHLAGGLASAVPAGTTVVSIALDTVILVTTGDASVGSPDISSAASTTGLAIGQKVTGSGIPADTYITELPGGSVITLNNNAFSDTTGATYTFTVDTVTISANALASEANIGIEFYTGAQVGYRMVFGRIETDINGTETTRLGAPSSIAIATNTSSSSTNVTVTGTVPKNSSTDLTFVQLYRSPQTATSTITPLDQYNLVYERALVAGDFTARVITITDSVPDSLVGIPLYCGSNQEGILQANTPPPMAWDVAKFRDFLLYGNITQPTSVKVTIISVGSPSGIQTGDTITISGSFVGTSFSEVYTAASSEVQASRQFKVYSGGTPSQNIADTANSLIRVINYDNALPVHAILLSSSTDLPGQILFQADHPNLDTFTITASAHATAYDPTLTNLDSSINTVNNAVCVSKSGELEAVPTTNLLAVGDSSSSVLRIIALRDYVFVIKTDGIYKIQGTSPDSLVVNPFDLTTKIIGAETAVSLNAGMWMLSNQGIVSVNDGGVEIKSLPIDNDINTLIDNYLDNLTDVSFAVGYESDRKYILFAPSSNNAYSQVQYNFNYTTNSITTWSRNFYTSFIHTIQNKLYVSRADTDNKGVSKERKAGTYIDFVDEGVANTITSVSGSTIGLNSTDGVEAGDILYQSSTLFSPILSVNLIANTIVVQYALSFTVGACEIQSAYLCNIQWKQVFADNPSYVRQYSEGLILFKNTRFNEATLRFFTDFSLNQSDVTVTGTGDALWGLFAWGEEPWGGNLLPSNIRFYVPQEKQLGSYLIPALRIKQGQSDFKTQGLSIAYHPVSFEVGL